MVTDCALTTFDNPFDPFEQFTSWLLYDNEKGYNSCGRVARVANFSDDMTQKEYDEEKERAIDSIVEHDDLNIFKKFVRTITNEDESDD